jgi:hypothetical protein
VDPNPADEADRPGGTEGAPSPDGDNGDAPVEAWADEDPVPDGPPGDGEDGEDGTGRPDRFARIRRTSAGVVMNGIALGLREALELPKNEPAFVIKAPSDPDRDKGPIDLHFDPDDPTKTVAVIRSRPVDDTPPPADPPT